MIDNVRSKSTVLKMVCDDLDKEFVQCVVDGGNEGDTCHLSPRQMYRRENRKIKKATLKSY